MANNEVVLAFFDNEDAADDAVEALKAWDKANKDVKLTSIGVMVLDDKGQFKTHKMGSRSAKRGAGIGLVAAVVFPPSLLAGMVGGALLGSLHHKSLGLNTDDRNRIAAELAGGKAAVGATVKEGDATAVSAKLAELGGVAEVYEVTEEAVAEVEAVAPAVEAEEVAAGDDLTVLDGIGPDYANSLRRGRRHHVRAARRDGPRGHRGAARRREHAADRGSRRQHLAPPGEARGRGGLVGPAALHQLQEVQTPAKPSPAPPSARQSKRPGQLAGALLPLHTSPARARRSTQSTPSIVFASQISPPSTVATASPTGR